MQVRKRNGILEDLNIKNIQKCTIPACHNLNNVSSSELEVDSHIKFVDGMNTVDIHNSLIHTAVDKITVDAPDWTYVAARLFIYGLYHDVGMTLNTAKGKPYGNFDIYLSNGITVGRLLPDIALGYDIADLNTYIKPERDDLFTYLGIKTLYDRYIIKDNNGKPIELPQYMFMAIAMFLAQDEIDKQTKAKEFYDIISKFEVMLATPTLSNARTNRHQLSSCYIGSSPDNIEGIFDAFKEMGLLSKFGGGIGWDWNQIRSLGGVIDNHKSAAGGVVPFLKVNNDIAIAVDQLGK
jgi:ribonucleoside-diphosphate reductase alpha chain